MKRLIYILVVLPFLAESQQLHIQSNALVHISEGANLEVGGDLKNDGRLENVGALSLYGDWLTSNNYNGRAGELLITGSGDQTILIPDLEVGKFIINSGGTLTYAGGELRVFLETHFENGILSIDENSKFILESAVESFGGSSNSYVQGKMTHKETGTKFSPLGFEGQYAPLTLFVRGAGQDQELTTSYQNMNPTTPVPGEDLLGVSHLGLWEVSLDQGSIDSTIVHIEFSNEDLENFIIKNEIRHRVNSPVIAFSDSSDGVFSSLGVELLTSTDSMTYGSLTTEEGILPLLNKSIFLAIALAPRAAPEGQVYIPQAFSPIATDQDNQTFKIFGEKILEENFRLDIYNRLGNLVYSTASFEEAHTIGWNGDNQNTGNKEPSGTYFYFVQLMKENEEVFEKNGALYLLR